MSQRFALVALLALIILAGCGSASTPPSSSPTATSAPKVWTTVQSFSGSTNTKTPIFAVPSDWKMNWTCTPAANSPNNLAILVYQANATLLDGALNSICAPGTTSGTTEEHQGGSVYLDVTAFEPWTITVQVLK